MKMEKENIYENISIRLDLIFRIGIGPILVKILEIKCGWRVELLCRQCILILPKHN